MRRIVSAIGSNVASPIVESMDVNAIIQEINWNNVIEQIDINDVLINKVDINKIFEKIDINRVLDRIDVNRHLNRVNYNHHLDQVDINALIAKSNLEEIISRSTSGVFSGIFNLIRTRMAWIDQWGQRFLGKFCCLCGCLSSSCCGSSGSSGSNNNNNDIIHYLPPRPGRHPQDSYTEWKNSGQLNQREFGKSIQFRCCGASNRILSDAIDSFFVWVTFALLAILISELRDVLTDGTQLERNNNYNNNNNNNDEYIVSWWIDIIIWMVYAFSYYVLLIGCFGRTIGLGILGLLMVSKNGNRVSILKVCGQGILNPLNKIFFGWIVGFIRRDGKMWSDLIGGVAIVYAWDSTSYMVDSKNNAEMAMSLTDFDNIIATEEKEEQEQEQEQEQEKKNVRATTSTDNSKKKNNNSSNDDDDHDDDDVDVDDIELGIRR